MLKVIIKDSNAVFALGLRLCLEQELLCRGKLFQFFDWPSEVRHADIIFHQVEPRVDCLLAMPYIKHDFNGIFFPIVEREQDGKERNLVCECLRHLPIIYRDEPLAIIMERVFRQLASREKMKYIEHDGVVSKSCHFCGRSRLSVNEIKVIKLLSKECSLTSISWILKKNVKTVFTQKKTAMKKLNLQNNKELYSFILNNRNAIELL